MIFGKTRFWPATGHLSVDGQSHLLGRRATALLLALLEAQGRLMTKDELLEKVWPGVIVEENTIHSQISALRKALGLARDLLQTVPGRGYVLLTSHFESEEASDKGPTREVPRIGTRGQTNLPPAGTTLVGRDLEIQLVLRALTISRLVTLTGPAGIGKTRLSQEVARDRLHAYPDGVFWIELASISNPDNVAQALGRTIGLPASAQSPEEIVRGIGPRAMLILLDNCEHVLESVAVLAEAIIQGTAAAHILTTTREALRIDHESIFTVPGLDLPDQGTVDTGVIASCGAVRLFLERAQSAGLNISLEAPMAQSVLEICRRLDGIPLAIELAAARSATLGVGAVRERLGDRFRLLVGGMRSALPRHRTLQAALDWSYELLSSPERTLLQRMSVFAGNFNLSGLLAVCSGEPLTAADVIRYLAELAAKSLVVTRLAGGVAEYRLLETMRDYARDRLESCGGVDPVSRAHAVHYLSVLRQAEQDQKRFSPEAWVALYGGTLEEVRAAVSWAFSHESEWQLAVDLTIGAIPLWHVLSLESEAASQIEAALEILEPNLENRERRMKLSTALGKSWMFGLGTRPRAIEDYENGLTLALELGSDDYALRSLWGMFAGAISSGRIREALGYAERFSAIATLSSDPLDTLAGDRIRGLAFYLLNDLPQARVHLQRVVECYDTRNFTAASLRYAGDILSAARRILGHVLWLEGRTDEAVATMEANVLATRAIKHPYSYCSVLGASSCPISLFTGDLPGARRWIQSLREAATEFSLDHWSRAADCFLGAVLVQEGSPEAGLELLLASERHLSHRSFLPCYYLPIRAMIGEALSLLGNAEEGLESLDFCFQPDNLLGRTWCLPEVERLRGECLLRTARTNRFEAAESSFRAALAAAREQGTPAWELRARNSLDRLSLSFGRQGDAADASGAQAIPIVAGQDSGDSPSRSTSRGQPRRKAGI